MDYKDYIKAEYCDAYVQERDNLADRLIEAKYNLLFLNMVYERDVIVMIVQKDLRLGLS